MTDGTAPRHSYDVRALDEQAETRRLAAQVEMVEALERPYIEALGLSASSTVIDLGCGPGYMTRTLAGIFPAGRVIGVDVSPSLLAQARERLREHHLPNAALLRAWADHLPIASGVANLVYARFLLQHLAAPIEVLREARRALRPDGTVVIVDTDDGGLVVHPEPPGLARLLAASHEAQARLLGDRHVGRKLRGHLIEAGFVDVTVEVRSFTSDMVGMDAFLDITLGYKRQIIPPDLMTPAEVEAVLAEVRALDPARGAFAHALGYVARGRAPRAG